MPDDRFEFGANWSRFLETVDETRVAAAVDSLQAMLGTDSLAGRRFLDVGSGSGLSSLAAQRLGAIVHSFDYDPASVACTQEMKQRFGSDSPTWTIEQGSALDADYLARLGEFDIVYSWGVLHHTGDMWAAIDLVQQRVTPGGQLWLAIYNDQGTVSERWTHIKRLYQRLPRCLRPVLVVLCGGVLLVSRIASTLLTCLVRLIALENPLRPWRRLEQTLRKPDARGMHRWYDLVDWVGGWPFEVARPEAVFRFLHQRGFELENLITCGGKMGCNEFLFRRTDARSPMTNVPSANE